MPVGAAARGPLASPGRGPMALVRAMLVMLVLMLSTLWALGVVPLPESGLRRGARWVWGVPGQAQAVPLLHPRRKRDEGGQQPSATTATPEHGHAATLMPKGNDADSPEPPAAPSTNTPLHRALTVPATAQPLDETDSPDPLPAAPGTDSSLHLAFTVPTTSKLQDETDAPDLPLSVVPAAPGTDASLRRALAVPTADQDETDAPDLLLSSVPPAPSTDASLHLVVTTAEPQDETDAPHLLLSSVPPAEPSTHRAPRKGITTHPNRPTAPREEEGTVTTGTDKSLSTPSVLNATTTGYREAKKSGATPAPTFLAPWDKKPQGTEAPVPWDLDGVMGKCLLAILLLALVAATFMVCTGVLGALLWRRTRMARHQLSPTEMICISSLLPDGDVATNGPKPVPAPRQRLLLDGGFDADGDSLTLSSFLPEHS